MPKPKDIKIGVNAFLIHQNKILLGKRLSKTGYGTWGLPGGHLIPGEDLVAGVKRELLEETGLKAKTVQFIQLINDPRQKEHYIQINFLIIGWSGTLKVMEPDKCERWEWFGLNQLPKNIFFGHKYFLPMFNKNIGFRP